MPAPESGSAWAESREHCHNILKGVGFDNDCTPVLKASPTCQIRQVEVMLGEMLPQGQVGEKNRLALFTIPPTLDSDILVALLQMFDQVSLQGEDSRAGDLIRKVALTPVNRLALLSRHFICSWSSTK